MGLSMGKREQTQIRVTRWDVVGRWGENLAVRRNGGRVSRSLIDWEGGSRFSSFGLFE